MLKDSSHAGSRPSAGIFRYFPYAAYGLHVREIGRSCAAERVQAKMHAWLSVTFLISVALHWLWWDDDLPGLNPGVECAHKSDCWG